MPSDNRLKRRGAYLQIILGSAVVGVILTLMGKMHWIGAALTGALVLARQMLPLLIAFAHAGKLRGQNTLQRKTIGGGIAHPENDA